MKVLMRSLIIMSLLILTIPNLYSQATSIVTYNRTIKWSGYDWKVKETGKGTFGPGPNSWSSSTNNVWVDKKGRLHLKITKTKDGWKTAEIVNTKALGYGTYRFYLESRVDALDPNVVVGMFTYDFDSEDAEKKNYREIDIEFSRWGNKNNPTNSNYTVQPYETPENNLYFASKLGGTHTNHSFTWTPKLIHFESIHGHNPKPTSSHMYVSKWDYKGKDIPDAGKAKVDLNLWLFQGKAPANQKEVEVIVTKFEFIPLKK